MKNLLTILFLLAPFIGLGQRPPIDTITKKVTYTGIVKADSLTKDQLYNNAKVWFVNTFKSADNVIQLDDKPNGRVIGKGYSQLYDSRLYYTVDISVKDGKYKYVFTDFTDQSNTIYPLEYLVTLPGNINSDGTYKNRFLRYLTPVVQLITDNINSLKHTMVQKNNNDF